jgi:hypothetical protein
MIMVMAIINCNQQYDVVVTTVHESYGESLPPPPPPKKNSSIIRENFRAFFGPYRLRLKIEPREGHSHLLPYPSQFKIL